MTQFSYHEILLNVKTTRYIKAENRFFLYRVMLRYNHSSNRQPNRYRVPMDIFRDFIPISLAL